MSSGSGTPAPHAPSLGLSHRVLGRFHVTGVLWYYLLYWATMRLPSWVEGPMVFTFTAFFFLALGRIRKAVASNLDPVLGSADRWIRWRRSWRTMWAFAWCLSERYRRIVAPKSFRAVLEGEENWRQAIEAQRGVILVTAHVGPWEAAAQLGASKTRRRIHVVREKEIDPRAQEFIQYLLTRIGGDYVTHFAGDDLVLGIELLSALRRGEIVALQADRPRSGGRTVEATVFGKPLLLPEGPAALARAADVPIVPVFNFREGRKLTRSVVRPPIRVARTPDREADITDAVQLLAADIEWAIRVRPHQWFCFKQLWD